MKAQRGLGRCDPAARSCLPPWESTVSLATAPSAAPPLCRSADRPAARPFGLTSSSHITECCAAAPGVGGEGVPAPTEGVKQVLAQRRARGCPRRVRHSGSALAAERRKGLKAGPQTLVIAGFDSTARGAP